MKKDNAPKEEVISRAPFPCSKKVFVRGELHDVKVAMREVSLEDTNDSFNNKKTTNAPVTIYDTSGPYTDPNIEIDIKKGLPLVRDEWIRNRGDVEELDGQTSEYGRERFSDTSLDHLRFEHIRKPLRAKKGKNVSQLHYARKGIITPEMEYIAIRENQRIEQVTEMDMQHPGQSFGANTPKGRITPEFVRDEIAAGRAIIPNNINHPES